MKVVHISPTYFGDESTVGGGERYAQELARSMADLVPTSLISFGPRRSSSTLGRLSMEIFPSEPLPWRKNVPFSARILPLLSDADIIHCHQVGTPANVLALGWAKVTSTPCFVTPLGLAPTRTEHRLIRLASPTALLCISQYSADHSWYSVPRHVVYGGVDTTRFYPRPGPKERKFVFVGRFMPHKGINYLIEAVDREMRLELYGRPYHPGYFAALQELARGKDVHFYTDASDGQIAQAYASALAAVLPSVHVDMYGQHNAEPELLGLALLEAMASGTAVVGTRVTSIPEVIEEGRNGYLVPPNDPAALRAALSRLWNDPDRGVEMGRHGVKLVRVQFTWRSVAERCLAAYGGRAQITQI